jgi:hypothetical protein
MLQEDDLREFIQIWADEFHETISMEQARDCASLLMELYALLARPSAIAGARPEENS